MTLQQLPVMTVFNTTLSDNTVVWFTFAEFIGWYQAYGTPLSESDQKHWFLKLCGKDHEHQRWLAYEKVLDFRQRIPADDERRYASCRVLRAYEDI